MEVNEECRWQEIQWEQKEHRWRDHFLNRAFITLLLRKQVRFARDPRMKSGGSLGKLVHKEEFTKQTWDNWAQAYTNQTKRTE
jgi:hypothetical protein